MCSVFVRDRFQIVLLILRELCESINFYSPWTYQKNFGNCKLVIDVVLVSLFLTLNRFHTSFWCPIVYFEQVNTGWRKDILPHDIFFGNLEGSLSQGQYFVSCFVIFGLSLYVFFLHYLGQSIQEWTK